MPILISLNVTRITKDRIKPGKNGKYLDLVLFERPDQYGNAGFVAESVSKDEREQGVKGAIVGNWRHSGAKPQAKSAPTPQDDDGDSIPF